MRLPITGDPSIDDPLIPDVNVYQHMALGYVERRIRIFQFLLYGSAIYLASGTSLLLRWAMGIDPRGAALMTDFGLMVLAMCLACAGAVAMRRIRPSVSLGLADESIRKDSVLAKVMLVFWVLTAAGVLILSPGSELGRVVSILAGSLVMLGIGVLGLLHTRSLRMGRDAAYARWLTRKGLEGPPPGKYPRTAVPGPERPLPEPSDFELRAVAYSGRISNGWSWILGSAMVAGMFVPLAAVTWAIGGGGETWALPALISLGLIPVGGLIGWVTFKGANTVEPISRRWYSYAMNHTTSVNRGAAILVVALAVVLFVVLAVAGRPGAEADVWPLTVAIPVMILSMVPMMLRTNALLHRRRELYLAWMIRNGLVTEEYAKAYPPR